MEQHSKDLAPQCECRIKETPRSAKTVRSLQNRLNRMVGQLNGIKAMLDNNRYCGDILIQVSAVESALQSFGYTVLKEHMQTCVTEKIKNDDPQIIEEMLDLMKKLK